MELTLDTYKRPATLSYKTPSSRRFFTKKARRLIRLARRIHDGRLFLPEIVSLLREAADELIELGSLLLLTEQGAELLHGLSWIKSDQFAPSDLAWDIREKTRHHVAAEDRVRCTLCRTHLVWPAQIVWRRGLTVVQVSADIGIHCLTRDAVRNGWGKLNDLITEVRAVRAKHAGIPEAPAQDAAPAPLVNSPSPSVPASSVPRPYPHIEPHPAPVFLQLPLVFPGHP